MSEIRKRDKKKMMHHPRRNVITETKQSKKNTYQDSSGKTNTIKLTNQTEKSSTSQTKSTMTSENTSTKTKSRAKRTTFKPVKTTAAGAATTKTSEKTTTRPSPSQTTAAANFVFAFAVLISQVPQEKSPLKRPKGDHIFQKKETKKGLR